MADHKYQHKYKPPACNTGVLKHRNTLTPHEILSRISVGVIEKSDESRDWNLLKYRNYRWNTAQKFLLTAQIWSRFMTYWDHPHCILSCFSAHLNQHTTAEFVICWSHKKADFFRRKSLKQKKNRFFSPPKQQRYVFSLGKNHLNLFRWS